MSGKSPAIIDYETAMHRVGQLEEAYESAMHRIVQLEAQLEKAEEIPTVVAEFDCGVLHKLTSSKPARFVWLDEYTEGADADQVIDLFGKTNYASTNITSAEEGVDPEYCGQVLLAVSKDD